MYNASAELSINITEAFVQLSFMAQNLWHLASLPRKLVFCIHTHPQTERNVYVEVVSRKIQMADTTSSV